MAFKNITCGRDKEMTKDEALELAINTIKQVIAEDAETNVPRCVALRDVLSRIIDSYMGP